MRLTVLAAAPLIALVVATSAAAGTVLDRIRAHGRVVIAYRENSVPFSYLGSDNHPVGYSIDLCHRIVDALAHKVGAKQLRIDYLPVTSATRIDVVASGQADLECESTTNTAERRLRVAFTVPHYITGARYLVRADSSVAQLTDFRGQTLASTAGTSPLKAVRDANQEHMMGIHVVEVPDHVRGVEMLAAGQVDGFAMDEVLLAGLQVTRPDPSRFKIVGKYLTIEPLAIMLPRDDPSFKQVVDDEMKRLIRSGEAEAMHDRWFLHPIAPQGRTLALPMPYLLRDFWKYPTDWVPQ